MMKIKKDLVITFVTVLIPTLLQFFYIRYASYEIDKNVYGDFILLQTLIAGLSYVFLQIPSQAYTRFFNVATDKTEFVNEFRTLLIFINFISLIAVFLYGYIMQKFSIPVLILVFFYFMISNNYAFNQNIFLLRIERSKYFYLKFMEAFAKFIAPVVAYAVYGTLFSLLAGIVFGYVAAFVLMHMFLKEHLYRFVVRIDNLKKYFKFAYPIFFVSLFTWGISFSDRYFIEFLDSTEQVAIYALLAQVAGIGQIIGQIYMMYVNPKVLKDFENDKSAALAYLSKMLKLLAGVFVLLMIIAYIMPVQVYAIVLEPKIIQPHYYFMTFMILLVGIFMTVFQTAYSLHFVLFKKLQIMGFIYFFAFALNMVGNLFITQYGIIAAAVSTLIAYLTILICQIMFVNFNRR